MTEQRDRGQRRWELDNGFPLIDRDGITVISERRRTSDRRLSNTTLEERLMMYSEMPLLHPEQKKRY